MADRAPDGTFLPGNKVSGRHKSPRRIEAILQRIGQQEAEMLDGTKVTRLELLMEKVYTFAEAGQQWAVQFVAERTEGKIRETQIEAPDDAEPIKIIDLETVKAEGD